MKKEIILFFVLLLSISNIAKAANTIIDFHNDTGFVTIFVDEEGKVVKEVPGYIRAYNENGTYVYAKDYYFGNDIYEYYYYDGEKEHSIGEYGYKYGLLDLENNIILKYMKDSPNLGLFEIPSGKLIREFEGTADVEKIISDEDTLPITERTGYGQFYGEFAIYKKNGTVNFYNVGESTPTASISIGNGRQYLHIMFENKTVIYPKDKVPGLFVHDGTRERNIKPDREYFTSIIARYISPESENGKYLDRWINLELDDSWWMNDISKEGDYLISRIGGPTFGTYNVIFDKANFKMVDTEYVNEISCINKNGDNYHYPYYDSDIGKFISYNRKSIEESVSELGYSCKWSSFPDSAKYNPANNCLYFPVKESRDSPYSAVVSYTLTTADARLIYKVSYEDEQRLLYNKENRTGLQLVYIDSSFDRAKSEKKESLTDRAIKRYKEYTNSGTADKLESAYNIAVEIPVTEFMVSNRAGELLRIRADYLKNYELPETDIVIRGIMTPRIKDPTYIRYVSDEVIFLSDYSYLASGYDGLSKDIAGIVSKFCDYTDALLDDEFIKEYLVENDLVSNFYEVELALDNPNLDSIYIDTAVGNINRTIDNFSRNELAFSKKVYSKKYEEALERYDFGAAAEIQEEILKHNVDDIKNNPGDKKHSEEVIHIYGEFGYIQDLIEKDDLERATIKAGLLLKEYMGKAEAMGYEAQAYADTGEFEKSRELVGQMEKYVKTYVNHVAYFCSEIFSTYADEYGGWALLELGESAGFDEYLKDVDERKPGNTKKKLTIVATAGLNVRSGPGTSYKVVTKVAFEDKVEKIDSKNGWYKVKTADGTVGWVCTGMDGEVWVK